MEPHEIHPDLVSVAIDCAFGLILFLAGFIMKAMWVAIDKLREDLADLSKNIARDYVRRDDFQAHAKRMEDLLAASHNEYLRRDDFKSHADRMEATLLRLFDRLDSKADRKD